MLIDGKSLLGTVGIGYMILCTILFVASVLWGIFGASDLEQKFDEKCQAEIDESDHLL